MTPWRFQLFAAKNRSKHYRVRRSGRGQSSTGRQAMFKVTSSAAALRLSPKNSRLGAPAGQHKNYISNVTLGDVYPAIRQQRAGGSYRCTARPLGVGWGHKCRR